MILARLAQDGACARQILVPHGKPAREGADPALDRADVLVQHYGVDPGIGKKGLEEAQPHQIAGHDKNVQARLRHCCVAACPSPCCVHGSAGMVRPLLRGQDA